MDTKRKAGCCVHPVSQLEEKMWVNATPDDEYPIRILEAHLERNEGSTYTDNAAGLPPESEVCKLMNQHSDERAVILRRAIDRLRESAGPVVSVERVRSVLNEVWFGYEFFDGSGAAQAIELIREKLGIGISLDADDDGKGV